ncbi:MAG: tyrosine protein phosphatase [Gammaproteobacteria bacterium]|nr:tyrosine protein phosphatase [Gammaproteobacteria bacterium]
MIDIHSHILPSVDDGAQSLDAALELLTLAQEDGVTTQFLTPHMRDTNYINDPEVILQKYNKFTEIVAAKGYTIKLRLSAEVRVGPEVMKLVLRDDFPWLGTWQGKKAFLLEMPHGQVPTGTINLIKWLQQRDIIPVIAHPERNREFQSNIDLLKQFIDSGCLAQLTAASLSGKFGEKSQRAAVELLEKDYVTFMATDTHNSFYRPPDLKAGYLLAKDIIGEEKAWSLVHDAPVKLLEHTV